jgi:hypothetical protein
MLTTIGSQVELALQLPSDPMAKLMVSDATLEGLGTYLSSANTVHNHAKKLVKKSERYLRAKHASTSASITAALAEHDAEPLNAFVHSLSDFFRHDHTPNNIHFGTRVVVQNGVTTSFELVASLGLGGLRDQWVPKTPQYEMAIAYAAAHDPIEIKPMVEDHLMSTSRLVTTVNRSIRDEFGRSRT